MAIKWGGSCNYYWALRAKGIRYSEEQILNFHVSETKLVFLYINTIFLIQQTCNSHESVLTNLIICKKVTKSFNNKGEIIISLAFCKIKHSKASLEVAVIPK